jgi:Flp pilus assembly protein TadG
LIGRRHLHQSPFRGLAHDCDGAVAAEFVIILLPLLLFLLGTLDVGLAVLAKTRISFAVEAAAKCGALNMAVCSSASAIAAYGASAAGLPGLDASAFTVTTVVCGISVTATYTYTGTVMPAMALGAGACYPAG